MSQPVAATPGAEDQGPPSGQPTSAGRPVVAVLAPLVGLLALGGLIPGGRVFWLAAVVGLVAVALGVIGISRARPGTADRRTAAAGAIMGGVATVAAVGLGLYLLVSLPAWVVQAERGFVAEHPECRIDVLDSPEECRQLRQDFYDEYADGAFTGWPYGDW